MPTHDPRDDAPLPAPDAIGFQLIESADELERACARWRDHAAVALDTEFVRERTFYPALGLLQVAVPGELALVDPLAAGELGPFAELLEDPDVVKVLHSCSEDLEVFDVHLGALPQPLFDTQVAATLVRPGNPPGYARLVAELFGIELPKGETRSNWLKRPLRPAQLDYAALDVAYLLRAQRELDRRLDELGRGAWLTEEMDRMLRSFRQPTPDEELYRSFGRAQRLDRRQLGALRELVAWRQRTARERDLPRSFVVKDAALLDLATQRPQRYEQLAEMEALDRRTAERHGRALLRVLREVRELPEDELPARLPRPTDLSRHKAKVNAVRRRIKRRAEALGVAPEILANRRTAERLVRRWLDGDQPTLPKALRGWREQVVGQDLLSLLGD